MAADAHHRSDCPAQAGGRGKREEEQFKGAESAANGLASHTGDQACRVGRHRSELAFEPVAIVGVPEREEAFVRQISSVTQGDRRAAIAEARAGVSREIDEKEGRKDGRQLGRADATCRHAARVLTVLPVAMKRNARRVLHPALIRLTLLRPLTRRCLVWPGGSGAMGAVQAGWKPFVKVNK